MSLRLRPLSRCLSMPHRWARSVPAWPTAVPLSTRACAPRSLCVSCFFFCLFLFSTSHSILTNLQIGRTVCVSVCDCVSVSLSERGIERETALSVSAPCLISEHYSDSPSPPPPSSPPPLPLTHNNVRCGATVPLPRVPSSPLCSSTKSGCSG